MLKSPFLLLLAAGLGLSLLPGCTSLMATASGPGPVDEPSYDRPLSQTLADIEIENTANIDIYKADDRFHDSNVNVISFYGTVLLTGQVATTDLKTKAGSICQQISGVAHVYNELTVAEPDYYLDRANDGLIATRVRSRLMFADGIPYARIKVVVDNGNVYLMGKISHTEANNAVNLIKNIHGIVKIIKILDYVNDKPSSKGKSS
ncbi:MAG: BON domain-containing protein [Pseudomonadales bacterium]|nr:BON domain-containing protein [Pseudomonadales bacterium]